MPPRSGVESARKWLHLAPGFLAFALPFVGFAGAVVLCAGLLGFNLWILPRFGGSRLWRPAEVADGEAWGILFYPLALLALAIAAGDRLEVLAGAWGMLAFGDAAATLVGLRWGRRPLPWNSGKSWIGSLAFIAASWGCASILVLWTVPQRYSVMQVLSAAALAALVGALVESLPWKLDDNLSVTLLGGAALFAGLEAFGGGPFTLALDVPGAAWGALAIAAAAVAASLSGALDRAGAVAGAVLALATLLGGGWRALVLLAFFVAAGTAASRLRGRVRRAPGHQSGLQPGQHRGHRPGDGGTARGVRNVLANGAVAAACGLLIASQGSDWALLAFGGALATATADTVGGELGQTLGGRTRRLTDGRQVAPGTDGGVSWTGSLATVAAAALIGGLGLCLGLFDGRAALIVAAAGTGGAMLDSLLGATFERRGLFDNEAVNCLSTLIGAWLAAQAAM